MRSGGHRFWYEPYDMILAWHFGEVGVWSIYTLTLAAEPGLESWLGREYDLPGGLSADSTARKRIIRYCNNSPCPFVAWTVDLMGRGSSRLLSEVAISYMVLYHGPIQIGRTTI
jgi:hypothetical protein